MVLTMLLMMLLRYASLKMENKFAWPAKIIESEFLLLKLQKLWLLEVIFSIILKYQLWKSREILLWVVVLMDMLESVVFPTVRWWHSLVQKKQNNCMEASIRFSLLVTMWWRVHQKRSLDGLMLIKLKNSSIIL